MSFQKRLSSGEFVVLAEMSTPKGVDISQMVTNARRIKGRVDAVVVPDMDNGVMRMSAVAGGVLMQQQGIESIIHLYGRDRNRMALQGDILSAYVLGIQNLLVVNSEDMANGDHRDAKVVDDLDALGIVETISQLEHGKDLSGFDLNGTPNFVTGATLAACTDDQAVAAELDAARQKIAAGAKYLVIPPVFNVDQAMPLITAAKALGVPVIATIFLIKSVGVARYMAVNDPSAHITEAIIKRIRRASDRETECLKLAGETIAELKDKVAGVKIETLGWEHRLPVILDVAGL